MAAAPTRMRQLSGGCDYSSPPPLHVWCTPARFTGGPTRSGPGEGGTSALAADGLEFLLHRLDLGLVLGDELDVLGIDVGREFLQHPRLLESVGEGGLKEGEPELRVLAWRHGLALQRLGHRPIALDAVLN